MKSAGIALLVLGSLGLAVTIGFAAAAGVATAQNDPHSDAPAADTAGACSSAGVTIPLLAAGIALWVVGNDHPSAPIKSVNLTVKAASSPFDFPASGAASLSGGVVTLGLRF